MLQSIVLSCYPFHILLLARIVANHGWTLQQGSIAVAASERNLFSFFALPALGLTWGGCFNWRWKSHPS